MRDDWKKFEGHVLNEKFRLQRFLGSTSYGAVFLTQSPPPQPKNLAIKFITSGGNADFQASLLDRVSKLSHPNLLRLLPGARCRLADMDLLFVLMEYAEEDLGRGLHKHPLGEKEAREMLGPLLDALGYIHSKGLAHSHIKPSNVMAIDNQLKLSSDTALPLGEPRPAYRPLDAYDAPEAGSAPVAPSSDIWSLGVTLVEVLTQQAPVSSAESQADPTVPSTIPQPFLDIAQHCLRRDPGLRWTTAQIADCLNPAPIQVAAPAVTVSAEKEKGAGKENPAVWPRPNIDQPFGVRCDECGKEYTYQPSDVLKYEMEVPASFAVHPLFRDSLEPDKTDKYESISSPQPTPKKRFVRTLEWVVGIACIILIVTEFSL